MVGDLVAFGSMLFVSELPGPLAMHIAAFTGLYTIVGCLGKPHFAQCVDWVKL
jgi:hypothetical protein